MADEKSDDIVSLEELLREDSVPKPSVASSVPASAAPSGTTPESVKPQAAQAAPTNGEASEVDKLLELEDPEFAAQMKEIGDLKADDVGIDHDIESAVQRERQEAATKGLKKVVLLFVKRPLRRLTLLAAQVIQWIKWVKTAGIPGAIAGVKAGAQKAKEGISFAIDRVRAGVAWFKTLPRRSKLLVISSVLLAIVALVVARLTLKDMLFPNMEVDYLTSLATVADAKYTIEPSEKWNDLNDPLLHPEHVVLIERIISNLKALNSGMNPMALIDLYIESANQEVAIELKNREGEARDVIGRTLLQMTYEELSTEAGKTKLKVFLRKNLNEVLTSGRVRRVYFKSIIVKP